MNEFDMNKMDRLAKLNARIQSEICRDTLTALSDEHLMDRYRKCPSVIKRIQFLEKNLSEEISDQGIIDRIIKKEILHLIPAGTKGAIRGNRFNVLVKEHIEQLGLDERFEIKFEKHCKTHETDETPDWYIRDKTNDRCVIGMNQLALWGGGQQTNRGSKYIGYIHNNKNRKLLCVVANEIELKSINNKEYKLFESGFEKNTLCYLKNLENILIEFFD